MAVTSTSPNSSRASRRNSSSLPHEPAQRLERALAEAPPDLRQRVGHLRCRQLELARELRVADAVGRREVVALEEREDGSRPSGLVLGAQLVRPSCRRARARTPDGRARRAPACAAHGTRERTSRSAPSKSSGSVVHAAAALQPRRRLPHVHHEAIGADANEGAELRLVRLVALEPGLLKRVGEEAPASDRARRPDRAAR